MQRLSRHLLEQIVALDEDAVVVTDASEPDRPLIYVNAAFERLTGYERQEVLGRNCRFLQGDDTDPVAIGEIRTALEASQACKVELVNYRKDGTPFRLELSIEPLRETRGGIRYHVGRMRLLEADVPSRSKTRRLPAERADTPGMLERDRFLDYARRDLGIARRQRSPLTILLFQITHLDSYRATFGDQAAESCVRMVGGRIAGGLRRAGDLCTRLDDDTFAALVLGQAQDESALFAKTLADQVAGMALHNPRSPDKFITVETSVVGGVPGPSDSVESLLDSAASEFLTTRRAG